jgi:hypothetical protein
MTTSLKELIESKSYGKKTKDCLSDRTAET